MKTLKEPFTNTANAAAAEIKAANAAAAAATATCMQSCTKGSNNLTAKCNVACSENKNDCIDACNKTKFHWKISTNLKRKVNCLAGCASKKD